MQFIVVLSVAIHILGFLLQERGCVAQGLSFNFTPLSQNTAPFLMPPIGDVLLQPDSIDLTAASNTTNLTSAPNATNLAGRLFYSQPLQLWNHSQAASFNCSFSFHLQQYPSSIYSSDGIAFLLVRPDSAPLPLTSYGGWLGLFNSSNNGSSSNQLVAVEFDTFKNPELLDPNENHIGIDINNIISNITQPNLGFALYNTTTFAWIDYNSPLSSLHIYATNEANVKPVDAKISLQVDLSQYLPEEVLIAFSAATGTSAQHHTVLSWSFSTTYHDVGNSSSSSSSNGGILDVRLNIVIIAILTLLVTIITVM